ncbi:MAG: hypothetical protein ACRD4B_10500, partial [Acidobacteriota bacterium]
PLTAHAATSHVSIENNSEGAHSSVQVNQEGSGQTTVCQNGRCTTTGGSSQSTVCLNGECKTYEDGNVDIQSDDGNTKVKINNHHSDDVSKEDFFEEKDSHKTPAIQPNDVTPEPTLAAKIEKVKKEVAKTNARIKERMKSEDALLSSFIESEIAALQKFIDALFY